MIHTKKALGGVFVSPHHLASQAGRDVLKAGGNAAEAMVAAAAVIATVYPHMNAIGGDGFWLLSEPGQDVIGIEACGPAAQKATKAFYSGLGHSTIPSRGPLAALTVPGTVSGWDRALEVARRWGGAQSLNALLAQAIGHAEQGLVVTSSQARLTHEKYEALKDAPGFVDTFCLNRQPPREGQIIRQPALAATFRRLTAEGLDSFYRGPLSQDLAADLAQAGSPIAAEDLAAYRARFVTPLHTELRQATLFNMIPPTQGMASLMILGMFDHLNITQAEGFDHVHGLIESTKQAFLVRDAVCTDPAYEPIDPADYLDREALRERAARIDMQTALPWPQDAWQGDTIWMGCIDGQGRMASFIQSIFWEFGSGVVGERTGVLFQNRGTSFSLDPHALHSLEPGRKPFHTLNPAMALFKDGRRMVYGTMGGEGQPQTQAAVFSRYGLFNQPLQTAISAPRWLLGKTWGEHSTTLKLENRFAPELVAALKQAGHNVEELNEAYSDTMGHAGAAVIHPSGVMEAAADPRSDGSVAAL